MAKRPSDFAPTGNSTLHALLYFVWLMLAWTVYVATVYPAVMDLPPIAAGLLNNAVRFGIFAIPVLVLTRRWQPTQLRALGITAGWQRGLVVGGAVGICWAAAAIGVDVFIQAKTVQWHSILPLFWMTLFSIVTIVEELSFRSYLLQALMSNGTAFAIVMSAAGFTLIHVPGWWLLKLLPTWASWISTSVSIFLLGCLLGIVFIRTKSLWACVLVHTLNNLAAAICAANNDQ